MPLVREEVRLAGVTGQPPCEISPQGAQVAQRTPKVTGLALQTLPRRVWQLKFEVEPRATLLEQPRGHEIAQDDEKAEQKATRGKIGR